ncbi:hypothetical protein NE237_032783 [Protea cynaroides]|uniref:Uncharacterized protein n=1 Tax=Protea cynaroides TaxID=273540 RepID=A0A9Q0L4L7_9MAGN|nr:hypothetical protein NE237_032783 [Protea cynaroides]
MAAGSHMPSVGGGGAKGYGRDTGGVNRVDLGAMHEGVLSGVYRFAAGNSLNNRSEGGAVGYVDGNEPDGGLDGGNDDGVLRAASNEMGDEVLQGVTSRTAEDSLALDQGGENRNHKQVLQVDINALPEVEFEDIAAIDSFLDNAGGEFITIGKRLQGRNPGRGNKKTDMMGSQDPIGRGNKKADQSSADEARLARLETLRKKGS